MSNPPIYYLKLARAYTAEYLPWFAPALYAARIHLTERVPVAAIDSDFNVYWNPKAVSTIAEEKATEVALQELGYLWVHEISHVLRDHADRATDMDIDAMLWNIAADFEINDAPWDRLRMPEAFPGMLPHNHGLEDGKIAEWYYNAILDDAELAKSLENAFKEKGFDDGSGVHGILRIWELEAPSEMDDKNETSEPPQSLDAISRQLIRMETAQSMHENRHRMGTIPAGWDIWIENILQGKVNWKKKLHHRLSIALAQGIGMRIDYSYSRPNRRQTIYRPIILPALQGDMTGRIACVVDTSGSMSSDFIGQALGEVFRILQEFNTEVTVIPCDAIAYDPILLRGPKDRNNVIHAMKGGGGTDMIVGIEAALALKPPPDSILVLTDGYTPYPYRPVRLPTVFGIILQKGEGKPDGPPNPPWPKDSTVYIEI